MKKILNPFEYLSSEKALLWGLVGTFFSVVLVFLSRDAEESGVLEVFSVLSTNVIQWLFMSTLLYLAALVFSPSRIRALDIYATNLFALLPTIVVYGISSLLFRWIHSFDVEPQSAAGLTIYGVYYLLLLISSISMVWSMVWGCLAFDVSANIRNWQGVVIFLTCFVVVNLVIQLIITYYRL